MFRHPGSSAIEQLRHLAEAGSARYGPQSQPINEHPTYYAAGQPRRRGWGNPFRMIRELLTEDAQGQHLHEATIQDATSVARHQNAVMSERARHAIDVDRTLLDDAEQRRGQEVLRSAECWTAIKTSDGMRLTGMRIDKLIELAGADFKDESVRTQMVEAYLDVLAVVNHRLRFNSYGLSYDPDNVLGRG